MGVILVSKFTKFLLHTSIIPIWLFTRTLSILRSSDFLPRACMYKNIIYLGLLLMLTNISSAEQDPYIVLVILEAKPGKEKELEESLNAVVEPHRSQKTCLDYKIHHDTSNPAKFGIYARWTNEEEHDKEFHKSYVQELLKKLEEILVKPLEVLGGHEL